jgi:hypothetical protein
MSRKSGSGLEKHVDKIVLAIAGLIGLYVLYAYVLTTPATVEYNGAKYGPTDLDKKIREDARRIEDKLAGKVKSDRQYEQKAAEFRSLMASPLKAMNDNIYILQPSASSAEGGQGVFDVPKVCDVDSVKARLITTVAYVPSRPFTDNDSYTTVETEMADLDFVTVEATIDTAQLSERFVQSFEKATLHSVRNEMWLNPVFAAVELERQELLKNGSWSDWSVVPRIKIDEFRKQFNVPQKVNKLDKSVATLMLQFDKPETKAELLQPRTYDFAYPSESWLPPTLDEKRQWKLDKAKAEERRKRIEEARKAEEERARSRAAARSATTPAAGSRAAPTMPSGPPGMGPGMGMPGMMPGMAPGMGGGGGMPGMTFGRTAQAPTFPTPPARTTPTTRSATGSIERSARTAAARTSTETEEQEFEKVKITEKTDFAAMKEPLLLWAHDDTTEPGKTYRYRIRVGVFDPIAGTDFFSERDKALKDDVMLWSNYSKVTEAVTVPARWCFFPLDYREADKMVNMHVCRYLLARWYSKDFRVKPGEVIGTAVEKTKADDSTENEPNRIDYSNGTVLVDALPALDRDYADALYAAGAKTIEHLAIKQQYWPSYLKVKFGEIERLQKEPAPVFAPRTGQHPGGTGQPSIMPGMPGVPGLPPGMMPGLPPGMMPGMPPR